MPTAEKKQIGLGSLLRMDPDGGTTYADVSMIKNITLPPQARAAIEARILGDLIDALVQGPREAVEMSFTQFWTPNATSHELIDTNFSVAGNPNAEGSVPGFQVVFPHAGTVATTVADTWTFDGWIKNIGIETIETNEIYTREVTIQVTTDITLGTYTIP